VDDPAGARVVADGAGAVRDDAGDAARTLCMHRRLAGGHENPHWTRYEERLVHFLDTDLSRLQLTKPKYRSLTAASQEATREVLAELSDDARHYRRVAFRLQGSMRAWLRGVFATK